MKPFSTSVGLGILSEPSSNVSGLWVLLRLSLVQWLSFQDTVDTSFETRRSPHNFDDTSSESRRSLYYLGNTSSEFGRSETLVVAVVSRRKTARFTCCSNIPYWMAKFTRAGYEEAYSARVRSPRCHRRLTYMVYYAVKNWICETLQHQALLWWIFQSSYWKHFNSYVENHWNTYFEEI